MGNTELDVTVDLNTVGTPSVGEVGGAPLAPPPPLPFQLLTNAPIPLPCQLASPTRALALGSQRLADDCPPKKGPNQVLALTIPPLLSQGLARMINPSTHPLTSSTVVVDAHPLGSVSCFVNTQESLKNP